MIFLNSKYYSKNPKENFTMDDGNSTVQIQFFKKYVFNIDHLMSVLPKTAYKEGNIIDLVLVHYSTLRKTLSILNLQHH